MRKKLLKEFSYYRTGGTYLDLIEPDSVIDLARCLKRINHNNQLYFLLGAGSNSLIMDEPWPGAVITFKGLNKLSLRPEGLEVEAGVANTEVATYCAEKSLIGTAWLFHLPGQIGATIRMNARCYGNEMSELVKSVTAITPNGEIITRAPEEIFLGYKKTLFMTNSDVVASAILKVEPGDNVIIHEKMNAVKKDRQGKHQFLYPSCGCVFKNDYSLGIAAGRLLERAGVQGFVTARVEVSPHHANFVFNKGEATAREILEITFKMREAVYQRFGVWLEYEMEILGLIPEDLKARIGEKRAANLNLKELEALIGPH